MKKHEMKLDLHLHTKYSGDSKCEPDVVAVTAKRVGLDGIAITDHNTTAGWRAMRAAGKKHGIEVVLGEEVRLHDEGEALCLFLTEPVESSRLPEIYDEVKAQGGIVVASHPFAAFRPHFFKLDEKLQYLNAIETINAKAWFAHENTRAQEFAKKHRMPGTGGGDAHASFEIGLAYTVADASSQEEFKKAILKNKAKPCGSTDTFKHIASRISNFQ